MKKIEKVIVVILLVTAILGFIINKEMNRDKLMVNVKNAANELIFSFNIYEDNYYSFDGNYGKFNIEVKDGKVRAIDVDCPNQICVHTGWISIDNPVPIICLPNGIMVMLDE